MSKCKNCETELTQMKNEAGEPTCLRCVKCHPLPNGAPVVKAKKENIRIDVPWTEERIRNIVIDELENWHKTTVLTSQKEGWGGDKPKLVATEVVMPEKIDWQGQAKALGINPYGRKKEIVLAEIAEKTKGPDDPVDIVNP